MKSMKNLLITFLLVSFLTSNADEYPWKKYGFDLKVVTLSNGKYQEFHDLADVVEIGSVLFNTQTQQIVGFVEKDTLYNGDDLTPHIVSRWVSPDPLSDEYSSWSPYNYTMNNPIRFVDPDGRYVDNYGVDQKGNVNLLEKTDDNYDVVYAVDNKGSKQDTNGDKKVSEADGQKVNDKSILPQLTNDRSDAVQKDWITGDKLQGNYTTGTNGKEMKQVFEFVASNSNVEWSFQGNNSENGSRYILGTVHENSQGFVTHGINGFDRTSLQFNVHSHPNATIKDFRFSGPDLRNASATWKINSGATYFVFAPKLNKSTWNLAYPNNQVNYEPGKYIQIK